MTAYSPTKVALAYVNWGRWVADCPGGCGSAERLDPGQDSVACSHCGHLAPVVWPDDAAGIWQALAMRALPNRRNWYPGGHPVALLAGVPHGQTIADLMAETMAHETDTEA